MNKCSIKMILGLAVATATLSGCAGSKSTERETVTHQWNSARAGVQFALANQCYQNGSLDKARQAIDQALALDPKHVPSIILSARIAIEQAQLEYAARQLELAGTLDPKNPDIDYFLGVIYQRWQRPESALECYARANDKAPAELSYLMARSEMLVSLGRQSDALALLSGKLSYFENSAAIRDAVGQLYVQIGQYPEACQALREARILDNADLQIQEHLALASYYNHQYRDAVDLLIPLLQQTNYTQRADLFTALGESCMQLNRPREARRAFESASQLDPASATIWVRLGKAAMEMDDPRRAEICMNKAIALSPSLGEAHLLLGYIHLKSGDLSPALLSFQQASSLDRKDAVSLCMIGYVLEKMGRSDQAMHYYAQALKIQPGSELATKLMAGVDAGPQ